MESSKHNMAEACGSRIYSPHRVRHRLCVDIQGCADVRVTQKFLLTLQIHSQGAQQGRVRMPKRVPSNPAKSGTNSGRKQVSSLDRPRPSWPPGDAAASGSPPLTYESLVDEYLSEAHRNHPGTGCPVSALAGDLARSDKRTRDRQQSRRGPGR